MPIVFLTGNAEIAMTVRAMKREALEFLTKPFDDEALLIGIRVPAKRDFRYVQAMRMGVPSRLLSPYPANECRKSGTLCFEVHKEKGCHAPPDLKTSLSRF
jgi:ActR/RegA family two-component response regulator